MKKEIIEQLNNILNKVVVEKKDICETLNNSTNLKLYEVAMLDNLDYDIFNDFCLYEYNNWESFLDEHYLEAIYIGRTSTFYLNPRHYNMYEFDYHGQINIKKVILLICEFSGLDTDYIKISNDGLIEDLEDVKYDSGSVYTWKDYFLKDTSIEYIYSDLENEVSKFFNELKEVKAGYEYLETFKENQIKIYTDYVDCSNF